MDHRLLGKEVYPAGLSPVQHLETLRLEEGLELRGETLPDVVQLRVGAEHHRHLQRLDFRDDLLQAGAAQGGSVQLPDAHLAYHVGLASGHATGIDAEPDGAARDILPGRSDVAKGVVPGGALWR
jgi:hypothetical protein